MMKSSKLVRSAAFAFALLVGGAGMTGTAFARPNTGGGPGKTTPTKKAPPRAGCQWNGVGFNDGDTTSSTVHHADGTSTVVTYTCSNGTWIS
ncbi:MAG: hypothetical protein JOZ37_15515 [Actinobacteria bacterium]|nr:hypothetical protein [Actinomycetota bacterium]MBV9253713.1 hypothetical protein [Actinomycetota bacterium]MBV9665376.1 hypothetical protein [Actinomycetota bacterium]MBV9933520.1 hypothetical protein [Actinomycetota bacterium]